MRTTKNCFSDLDHKMQYVKDYDSYWCYTCDMWAEGICGDDKCDFCSERPTRWESKKP